MIFSQGFALAGERVLPVLNRKGRLLDRWGLCVERSSGLVTLESPVMRPEVCAMICLIFRLPFNEQIRSQRLSLISSSRYDPRRDTLVGLGKNRNPVAIKRLQAARVTTPPHVVEMFNRYGRRPVSARHSARKFELESKDD